MKKKIECCNVTVPYDSCSHPSHFKRRRRRGKWYILEKAQASKTISTIYVFLVCKIYSVTELFLPQTNKSCTVQFN